MTTPATHVIGYLGIPTKDNRIMNKLPALRENAPVMLDGERVGTVTFLGEQDGELFAHIVFDETNIARDQVLSMNLSGGTVRYDEDDETLTFVDSGELAALTVIPADTWAWERNEV